MHAAVGCGANLQKCTAAVSELKRPDVWAAEQVLRKQKRRRERERSSNEHANMRHTESGRSGRRVLQVVMRTLHPN